MIKQIDRLSELIHNIRGRQVMLDSDLARMYGVEIKRLNEAVKRNIKKFPPSFMFQLTIAEYDNLISQFAISSAENDVKSIRNLRSQIATSSWGGHRTGFKTGD